MLFYTVGPEIDLPFTFCHETRLKASGVCENIKMDNKHLIAKSTRGLQRYDIL